MVRDYLNRTTVSLRIVMRSKYSASFKVSTEASSITYTLKYSLAQDHEFDHNIFAVNSL